MGDFSKHTDICENNHGGNKESVAAHSTVVETKEQGWAFILALIERRGPHNCDEFEAATGMKHQTASARFSELRRDGKLVVVGKRPTRSGRMAAVMDIPRKVAGVPDRDTPRVAQAQQEKLFR